ncbi:hypothetical protein FB451DRAFT_1164998 [Mycena latifolia]|nr:hypothetical protein FB451DRAFT_1164998 [Mycena latifolia]
MARSAESRKAPREQVTSNMTSGRWHGSRGTATTGTNCACIGWARVGLFRLKLLAPLSDHLSNSHSLLHKLFDSLGPDLVSPRPISLRARVDKDCGRLRAWRPNTPRRHPRAHAPLLFADQAVSALRGCRNQPLLRPIRRTHLMFALQCTLRYSATPTPHHRCHHDSAALVCRSAYLQSDATKARSNNCILLIIGELSMPWIEILSKTEDSGVNIIPPKIQTLCTPLENDFSIPPLSHQYHWFLPPIFWFSWGKSLYQELLGTTVLPIALGESVIFVTLLDYHAYHEAVSNGELPAVSDFCDPRECTTSATACLGNLSQALEQSMEASTKKPESKRARDGTYTSFQDAITKRHIFV